MSVTARADAVIVGAGHNGLVAATLLARAGLDVFVVERARVVGGAARTERPFAAVPDLAVPTGADLLGPMPPELLAKLGLELPLLPREPHTCLPTGERTCLLLGADRDDAHRQIAEQLSDADARAWQTMHAQLANLRDDLAPSWLVEPLSVEETAERWVRPPLRGAFVELCRGSAVGYLDRFGFRSERLMAALALAGGAVGSGAGIDAPGSGVGLLLDAMCRLPDGAGGWVAVRGGLGTVTQNLAYAAVRSGARVIKGDGVASILVQGGAVTGVALDDGREIETDTVLCNADPFRMRELVGRELFPDDFNARLDGATGGGAIFKLCIALTKLPELTCAPGSEAPFRGTIQLLPEQGGELAALRRAHADASEGRLPELPAVHWITHTAVDPSLCDPSGRHAVTLLAHWVPARLADGEWEAEEGRFARHLLSIADRFAPGTSRRVIGTLPLSPPAIEQRFALTGGRPHHLDNSLAFADRLPYTTPIDGLYSCSAATHPGGAVTGVAGHNAAERILADRRH